MGRHKNGDYAIPTGMRDGAARLSMVTFVRELREDPAASNKPDGDAAKDAANANRLTLVKLALDEANSAKQVSLRSTDDLKASRSAVEDRQTVRAATDDTAHTKSDLSNSVNAGHQVSKFLKPEEPKAVNPSYLQTGIDSVTSQFISNPETRHTVNHLTAEFAKTAAMFAVKKVGWGGVAALYGLDQASPSTGYSEQLADLALGAAKGVTIRGVFHFGGTFSRFAPTKGVAMGMASRAADDVLQRETFSDPNSAVRRLSSNTFDARMMALDAVVWTGAEATFGAANAYTRGALVRNPLASGVTMGTTFGAMNGAGGELLRQIKEGKPLDYVQIAEQGTLGAVMSGAGAAAGIKGSLKYYELKDHLSTPDSFKLNRELANVRSRSDDAPKPAPRQFIITSGKEALETFRDNKSASAFVTAREMKSMPLTAKAATIFNAIAGGRKYDAVEAGTTYVGTTSIGGKLKELGARYLETQMAPEQRIYFQRLSANETRIAPEARLADLIVTCYPENLTPELREKHAFPDGVGKVWMLTDRSNKLLLTNELVPTTVRKWREGGFSEPTRLDAGQTKLDLMAPLLVGDPKNLNSETSRAAWDTFDKQLAEAKKLGINSISTDVWWGLIEPRKGEFDFSYIDKLADHIEKAGLRWIPILSFHECGGNIGDTVNIPLPEWVWPEVAKQMPGGSVEAAKYKSEQGHTSDEYISLWADEPAVKLYANVMEAFQKHYQNRSDLITEINVSLGPAGEMRYPSYNSHDVDAGYPTRGALQAYSEPAKEAFRQYAITKYGDLEGVKKAWGFNLSYENIAPPAEPKGFFERNDHHHMQYGQDFFDFYNQSLIDHGNRVMSKAQEIFSQKGAPFAGVDLGAKVPGVHWRVGRWEKDNIVHGDRLAELAAGLIRTSRRDWQSDDAGRGYRPVLEMFRDLHKKNDSDTLICPSFTCLELPDGDNGPDKMAMPFSLATWFGKEGERQGLWLRGENALSHTLADKSSWDRVRTHLFLPDKPGAYHGVTFLRMGDVVENPDARAKLSEIIHAIQSVPPSWWDHFHRLKDPDRTSVKQEKVPGKQRDALSGVPTTTLA